MKFVCECLEFEFAIWDLKFEICDFKSQILWHSFEPKEKPGGCRCNKPGVGDNVVRAVRNLRQLPSFDAAINTVKR